MVPGLKAQAAGSSSSSSSSSLEGMCTCNCCLGQLPHIHALVAESTLSLATSVDIITADKGVSVRESSTTTATTGSERVSEFHFLREKEYVVSMSRVDDVLMMTPGGGGGIGIAGSSSSSSSTVSSSDCRGPIYRVDCIADHSVVHSAQ